MTLHLTAEEEPLHLLLQRSMTLRNAERLVCGDRQDAYGDPEVHFAAVAQTWSMILDHDIRADQVPLMMAGLKLVRASHNPSQDSFTDLCGYAALASELAANRAWDAAREQMVNSA